MIPNPNDEHDSLDSPPDSSPKSSLESSRESFWWDAVDEATELLMDKNPSEALVCLRDVVRKDPQNPYAFYYIGTAFFELGRFDQARIAYEAALRLSPKYLAALVGLSHAVRIAGDPPEAIRHARRALRQCPGDGDALFALGLALASNRDRDGAIAALTEFLRTRPEFEVAMEARAMLDKLGSLGDESDDD
ncbi:MAG: tetratricopeptide repeat protein [Polyangiaceae bacterium]|nr:tetratricopeptide repeat protein [Polyangiaceae bacterium]